MMLSNTLYMVRNSDDADSGRVLVEHVEKEETSMGYLVLLELLFKKYGKPRLIVSDERK